MTLMISGVIGGPCSLVWLIGMLHLQVKVRKRERGEDGGWIDSELRSLMRTRSYYRRKHHNQEDWDTFKALRNEVNRRIWVAKTEHYRSMCNSLSHQPKSTWKRLNSALGRNKCGAINVINCGGKILTKTRDIVNRFVRHFSFIKSTSPNTNCQLQPVTTKFTFSRVS